MYNDIYTTYVCAYIYMCVCVYVYVCVCMCISFPGGLDGKDLPVIWEIQVWSLGQEDLLEEEMATHSSILAWRIPWTEECSRLLHGVLKSQARLSLSDYPKYIENSYNSI